jgi:hypothetical protein
MRQSEKLPAAFATAISRVITHGRGEQLARATIATFVPYGTAVGITTVALLAVIHNACPGEES